MQSSMTGELGELTHAGQTSPPITCASLNVCPPQNIGSVWSNGLKVEIVQGAGLSSSHSSGEKNAMGQRYLRVCGEERARTPIAMLSFE